MINFRYHIVSLMAVFLALAVGITLGVTLVSGEANKGLASQAEQDRRQVQTYREQISNMQELDKYRDAYASQVGKELTADMLVGVPVAIVTMPDAPRSVTNNLQQAVRDSGGTVASVTTVKQQVFDPTQRQQVLTALQPFSNQYKPGDDVAARFGKVLGRALLSGRDSMIDQMGNNIGNALNGSLISLDRSTQDVARLVIVVSAPASTPPLSADMLKRHVDFDVALSGDVQGHLVVAGPNSTDMDATDVATVRTDPESSNLLSSVDAADLPSGISTVMMAGAEQLEGGQGHYGWHSSADAPAPELPIR
ncbi:hypothetical protein GCM10011575_04820 [Microlunatus endophyticus]|uniref:Copper transport outer membrane protein, MctB n=1 Tax=Microlunatus endophyticus TaxID=1716077 RepID=A0A917W171_9ACTN|nr:copper transporter [Microlunatus endophyticus]GGL49699.1 hypothetical protein GCM10011575_04820 [Microlunatus endophyticus]